MVHFQAIFGPILNFDNCTGCDRASGVQVGTRDPPGALDACVGMRAYARMDPCQKQIQIPARVGAHIDVEHEGKSSVLEFVYQL